MLPPILGTFYLLCLDPREGSNDGSWDSSELGGQCSFLLSPQASGFSLQPQKEKAQVG
jgi:hypothetical protein